jgi:segregation and condensation protein B
VTEPFDGAGGPTPEHQLPPAEIDITDAATASASGDGAEGAGAEGARETEALDLPSPALRRVLEAVLLVVDEPVGENEIAQVAEVATAVVRSTLEELAGEYREQGRGFELRQVAGGWRLYTAADCAAYVERFVLEGRQARLTQAALETLAVVAYRQPVSRQAIAAIRGVNVDGVVRTLLTRGLISEISEDPSSGAHLYGTTPYFLERLGVDSLDALPSLAPLLPVSMDEFETEV